MISEDFINFFKMLEGRLEHFATFSEEFPKISEDFKKFRKVVAVFVFALSGAFS